MPPIRHTRHTLTPPHGGESWHGRPNDPATDPAWPAGLRALLLISGAVAPDDPSLARTSNEDLALLRVSMSMLASGDHTSAA